jgi:hypothetical protein
MVKKGKLYSDKEVKVVGGLGIRITTVKAIEKGRKLVEHAFVVTA